MTYVFAAVMRDAMTERLAGLERLASNADFATSVTPATTELGTLASAMREILDLHQPDRKGRCRSCAGLLRNHRFPCRIWRIAHHHLLIPSQSSLLHAGRSTWEASDSVPWPTNT
ncbi:hypothetical protein [Kibdelosporangium persicum]|uniref:hypothetical protein n=1 Tax=Kibdelosporangium persicum TaxID=2698649 RepID=UPI001564A9A6|nr:hypothetical protein [Kibdelosporangium persicum]